MDGQKFAQSYESTTKAVSGFLVRLAELIVLAAVFDAASSVGDSNVVGLFGGALKVLVGAHFATIYKPIFLVLDKFSDNLTKRAKLLILVAISVPLAPIVFLTSIGLSEAVQRVATISGSVE